MLLFLPSGLALSPFSLSPPRARAPTETLALLRRAIAASTPRPLRIAVAESCASKPSIVSPSDASWEAPHCRESGEYRDHFTGLRRRFHRRRAFPDLTEHPSRLVVSWSSFSIHLPLFPCLVSSTRSPSNTATVPPFLPSRFPANTHRSAAVLGSFRVVPFVLHHLAHALVLWPSLPCSPSTLNRPRARGTRG